MASDTQILNVLAVLLWATWLLFVACLVSELAAQLRGRPPATVRRGSVMQQLAGYLVASLLMPTGVLSSLGSPAEASPAPVAAVHEPTAAPIQPMRKATAWSVAETHPGVGALWRDNWELNRDRVQPDGRRWLVPDEDIQPGWRLLLPDDAVASDQDVSPPIGLIGGGLAVTGALVLLERRRRAQQRHRRPRRAVPLPSGPLQRDEQALRAAADPETAVLVEAALRAAAAGSTSFPSLRWVEARLGVVALVLSEASAAPQGFRAADGGRWESACGVDDLRMLAARAEMPTPTLVPLGRTDEGVEVLVELESHAVTSVAGPPVATIELLRAVALAAATSPWHENANLLLVGMAGELTTLPWVKEIARLGDAITALETHAQQVSEAMRARHCGSTAQLRASPTTLDEAEPLLLVSAVPPGDEVDRQRLATLAREAGTAVGVVLPAPLEGSAPGRQVAFGVDGRLRIEGVDTAVWPHRLQFDDGRAVESLLTLAARRDGEPAGPASMRLVTDAAAPGSTVDALLSKVDVLIRVLGKVEAVRLSGTEQRLVPKRQKELEALAYLALREAPVGREDLEIRLFPDGAHAAKTIYNTISAARALVGEDLFPPPGGGEYVLSERVATDYGLFCELIALAEATEDVEQAAARLTEALGLVRGEPFTGVGRGYAWVGPHRGMIVAQVVDAAEELAEIRLATGEWRLAEWAARQGLRAFPSDERMYRLIMRAARAAGNVSGVHRAFRELCEVIADPYIGVEPEDTVHPETVELLEELTQRPRIVSQPHAMPDAG